MLKFVLHMPESQENLNSYPQVEQQVPIEQTKGLLNKLRLGRLAIFCGSVEAIGVVASVIAKDPAYAELGGYADAVVIGGSLFGAHQYFRNNDRTAKDLSFAGVFIKDKSTDERSD